LLEQIPMLRIFAARVWNSITVECSSTVAQWRLDSKARNRSCLPRTPRGLLRRRRRSAWVCYFRL